jgi:hypothetical protein
VLARLAAACFVIPFMVGAADRVVEAWCGREVTRWVSHDPRKRLLWDPRYDGSSLVLLGDSAFSSHYVNAPEETLWARLAALSGRKVYPGALNGATPADLLMMASAVADRWPAGTVVFVNLVPTRLYQDTRAPLQPDQRYQRELDGLTSSGGGSVAWLKRADIALSETIRAHMFLARNRDAMQAFLSGRMMGREPESTQYFQIDASYDRRWNVDGDFALKRYRGFEVTVAYNREKLIVPLSWVLGLHATLARADLRPVFVLSPLNSALVHEYSRLGNIVEQAIAHSHATLVRALRAHNLPFVDLSGALAPEQFADLNHSNGSGDATIAKALNEWLVQHEPGSGR